MDMIRRIMTCRLLEKIDQQKDYGKKLKIQNVSKFHGVQIKTTDELSS